jgi:eukaryotic-like serine/threonine-protein kinase
MTNLIGRILGQYQIVGQIGQGGMATVFKAYQFSLDRYVALKILPPLLAGQADFGECFKWEAKAIAKLNHPNILPVFDFGQADAYSFLVMRYIKGAQTLKDVMEQPLTLSQIADLMSQVAAALDYAHRQGVIHRDVKPSNVLMDGKWALLSDFGLAKMAEVSVKLTGMGVGMGTPAYMSPEQAQGQPVDQRTDIYALGIMLYEMLTGQPPHQADTPLGVILQRLSEPLPLPRSLNPTISEAMERVVLKALAANPDDRFESAAMLAEALKTAVHQAAEEFTVVSSATQRMQVAAPPKSPLTPPSTSSPGQKLTHFFKGGRTEQQAERNRQAMLKLVHDFWIKGVLENSLHGLARLELGLTAQTGVVEQPWKMMVQTPQVSDLSIPPGTRLSEVFRVVGEALLILGEPGAGKTTMLLELARDKIAEVEADPTQPLPVVFNLASWEPRPARFRQPGKSFQEWLVAELNNKYYLPQKIAQSWVENDELLLLLDGLDEVVGERREACVQAINDFRQAHLAPLVVCSRVADYELLTTKLKLPGAVLIQPPTPHQVETYLAEAEPELAALREVLRYDEPLQELAQSPLMLSTIMLAYRGLAVEELLAFSSVEARRRHLFETYTQRMFERRGVEERYSPGDIKRWLAWIAQKMPAHSQSVFLMEQLQPSWLATYPERRPFLIMFGLLVGLAPGLMCGLFLSGGAHLVDALMMVLIGGLIGGLCGWLTSILKPKTWLEALNWSWLSANKGFITSIIGLISGLLVGLIIGTIFSRVWSGVLFSGFAFGGMGMFIGMLIYEMEDIIPINALRWSWSKAGIGLTIGLTSALSCGLLFGFLVSVVTVVAKGAHICRGVADGPECGLRAVLLVGVLLGSLFGPLGVLSGLQAMKVETSTTPNQGIRQSARNAVIGALCCGLVVGLGLMLMYLWANSGLFPPENYQDSPSTGVPVAGVLTVGLLFGFVGGLALGGRAVIQHYTLRFILWRKGYLPWNLARFLDYAVERIFLRKVGGGYIFIHRLLLDYFARLG